MTYLTRLFGALFARPIDTHEALQGAADLQETIATGERILADRLTKSFGREVMVKCLNESWVLVAEHGAPWGLLTQHTLSDVHFNPEVERDVLQGLYQSRRLQTHSARYRPPRIGVIS